MRLIEKMKKDHPTGRVEYIRSSAGGNSYPCAVCSSDQSTRPKPLIIEVSLDAIEDLQEAVFLTEKIVSVAVKSNRACVVLRPKGRGPGTVYQNYGEVILLEAIEHAVSFYPIDRNRISVTGFSMGGASVWYLASHYPDLFEGAVSFSGYCDYRLWEKPGGYTYHMNEWEEHSWKSRSTVFLVENFEHTPVWIIHGEWDRGVGSGVSVEHSRRMAELLDEQGYDYKYTEVKKAGHEIPDGL